MKLTKPVNANYCATVVQLKNIIPLEGCDNVVGTTIFGFQAIVQKTAQVGDIGIVFPAETQLSEVFASSNNLYRHSEKNKDPEKKGYIEDNRRIRAVKFRGHASNCLFLSLDSLSDFCSQKEIAELKVGDEFDMLNDLEVCRKYVIPVKAGRGFSPAPKKDTRVDSKHMPEHIDSDNYHKWGDTIPNDKHIIVTQKLHGTSVRVGHTFVKRKLTVLDKVARFFGATVQEFEHDYVYGSRKVIKDANNPNQAHYYGSDIWTKAGDELAGLLPQNFIVYGELVGWTDNGAPIQKGYTYSVAEGKAILYVYRIAIVNHDGFMTDLSWDQVKEFCNHNGLNHVPELWRGPKSEFDVNDWMDKRYCDYSALDAIALSDPDTVDEGVCVRVDGLRPRILKATCAKFFEHETKMLDTGEIDVESEQSA